MNAGRNGPFLFFLGDKQQWTVLTRPDWTRLNQIEPGSSNRIKPDKDTGDKTCPDQTEPVDTGLGSAKLTGKNGMNRYR